MSTRRDFLKSSATAGFVLGTGTSGLLSALSPRIVSMNGAPRNIHRKHGVNVTQVVSTAPSVAAPKGGNPPGWFQPPMNPTNCSTMMSGPGVVSAKPRPSIIWSGFNHPY